MKILVSFSGGKDSHACLLWSVRAFGAQNVEAVFCDTGFESPLTYHHIREVTSLLGVKLTTVQNSQFPSLPILAQKKGRFPSVKARFCSSELKAVPFIDYILTLSESVTVIQGIRAQESSSRSKMSKQCTFFKYYFEKPSVNGKTHSYRKADIINWLKLYNADILRPVFDWSGQEVIDYIIKNGHSPNPLYSQGFKRVGCFPCILASHGEIYQMIKRYPARFDEIVALEKSLESSFFKIDSIPEHSQTGVCSRTGKSFTTAVDLRSYLTAKNATLDLFDNSPHLSCSSYYHLCE